MDLVILAAGLGSRFGGLKQMEPMDEYGNFIIDYSIYDAIEAGFDRVVFIIKEDIYEEFKNTIGKRIESKIETAYAFQKLDDLPMGYQVDAKRTKPWGTGQAILAARDVVKGHFMIINADDYYGKDAFKVAYNYLSSLPLNANGQYANVAFRAKNTITENGSVKRGVCIKNDNNELAHLIEASLTDCGNNDILATPLEDENASFHIPYDQLVSMNMFIFTHDIFEHLQDKFPKFLDENKNNSLTCEYLIPSVVSELIEENKASVKILSTTSTWYGVTYFSDKEIVVSALKGLVEQGLYKKGLWK